MYRITHFMKTTIKENFNNTLATVKGPLGTFTVRFGLFDQENNFFVRGENADGEKVKALFFNNYRTALVAAEMQAKYGVAEISQSNQLKT